MKLKDISIDSELIETIQAITDNRMQYPNDAKGDIFLIEDFNENLEGKIELKRDLDGKCFEGTLESVKINISPFEEKEPTNVLYLIKLKEFDTIFEIQANSIEYNKNDQKRYYFKVEGRIEWRVVFFK